MLLYPYDVSVGLYVDMVVYLDKLGAELILGVGYSVACARIDDDTERVFVELVVRFAILAA